MSDYSEESEEMGFNYQYQLSPDLSDLFQYTISEGKRHDVFIGPFHVKSSHDHAGTFKMKSKYLVFYSFQMSSELYY